MGKVCIFGERSTPEDANLVVTERKLTDSCLTRKENTMLPIHIPLHFQKIQDQAWKNAFQAHHRRSIKHGSLSRDSTLQTIGSQHVRKAVNDRKPEFDEGQEEVWAKASHDHPKATENKAENASLAVEWQQIWGEGKYKTIDDGEEDANKPLVDFQGVWNEALQKHSLEQAKIHSRDKREKRVEDGANSRLH